MYRPRVGPPPQSNDPVCRCQRRAGGGAGVDATGVGVHERHSTAWTRIEQAKRKRETDERHRDDDGFRAARKPDWSSGSDVAGDEEDDQHGQVYVVTEASKSAPEYLPGAEHWRSVHCAFGSLRCR